jgi:hypothetical protein
MLARVSSCANNCLVQMVMKNEWNGGWITGFALGGWVKIPKISGNLNKLRRGV